jgi:hypothetical protein
MNFRIVVAAHGATELYIDGVRMDGVRRVVLHPLTGESAILTVEYGDASVIVDGEAEVVTKAEPKARAKH